MFCSHKREIRNKSRTFVDVNLTTDEFFITIATTRDVHSFVMLGVKQGGHPPIFLARIGKNSANDPAFKYIYLSGVLSLFRGNTVYQAQLGSEPLDVKGKVTYSSYTITYKQYKKFIEFMTITKKHRSKSASKHPIICYQPTPASIIEEEMLEEQNESEQDTPITRLEFGEIPDATREINAEEEKLLKKFEHLTLDNTCRNTAIDLLTYTQGKEKKRSNLSTLFFRNLPSKVYFEQGKPSDYFYILPVPPSSEMKNYGTLALIYTRMENLIQSNPKNKLTNDKFLALKTLYNELNTCNVEEESINDLLDKIADWKIKNGTMINELRKNNFFTRLLVKKTATLQMVEKIEADLKSRTTVAAKLD